MKRASEIAGNFVSSEVLSEVKTQIRVMWCAMQCSLTAALRKLRPPFAGYKHRPTPTCVTKATFSHLAHSSQDFFQGFHSPIT